MQSINQEVIKAREVVAGYKKYNQKTVEVISSYDPVLKIRTFKKVSIDENHSQFKKEFCAKPKKEKSVKAIQSIKPFEKKKVSKPTVRKATKQIKPKYTPRPPKTADSYDQNNLTSKVYALHLQGIRNDLIAEKMEISLKRVRQLISVRRNQLGVEEDFRSNKTYENVKKLFLEGKGVTEIAYLVNVSVKNVYNLLIRVKKECKSDNRENEFKEILEVIKAKMKLNQVDYCLSSWITPQKVKYKTNINKLEVVALCKELVEKGDLILIEHDKKNLGKMFKLNLRN